jgi:hypothetical protein
VSGTIAYAHGCSTTILDVSAISCASDACPVRSRAISLATMIAAATTITPLTVAAAWSACVNASRAVGVAAAERRDERVVPLRPDGHQRGPRHIENWCGTSAGISIFPVTAKPNRS